jgi:shikimate dehydrogenase
MSIPKAFVAGHPIAHSRSPLIHGHWLEQHGLAGSYERIDVEPQNFDGFFRGFAENGFRGGNVTIPHKEAAFRLADATTERARRLAAVNTLWIEDGRVHGDNTDVAGFLANLADALGAWRAGVALVLGAGGAARAAVYALRRAGAEEVLVWNRTKARAERLVAELGGRAIDAPEAAALLVNCTSVGLRETDSAFKSLPIQADTLGVGTYVADMVYRPGGTELLHEAKERGATVVTGMEILIAQGAASFERWTGRTASREAMRAAVADNAQST